MTCPLIIWQFPKLALMLLEMYSNSDSTDSGDSHYECYR